MSFPPGAVIVQELDVGRRLLTIREGIAQVVRRGIAGEAARRVASGKGDSRRLATLGPGEVVGELSLIDGMSTSPSVVAGTALDALVLYRSKFNKLFDSTPQLTQYLLVGLAARVRDFDRRHDLTG